MAGLVANIAFPRLLEARLARADIMLSVRLSVRPSVCSSATKRVNTVFEYE